MSETEASKAPIIIKRIKKAGHAHHGGAWKVAYADMTTALMAFFIVLWILGQGEEVVAQVSGYFKDPVGFIGQATSRNLESGSRASEISIVEDAPPAPPAPATGDGEEGGGPPGPGERHWRTAAQAVREALEATPNFAQYRDQVELSLTPEGLRISLVETRELPLFKSGALELNPEARALFQAIGQQLSRLPNHIAIEGHTDSSGFGEEVETSNWDLSTGRANTARRELVAAGVHHQRLLEVRGLADRQLYNPLDPSDSRNRRISITLLSKDAIEAREELAQEELIR